MEAVQGGREASQTARVVASGAGLRALAAIASFGVKNLEFLNTIIRTYLTMPISVDVVVLSDAAKPLPPAVELRIGLPSRNPWSLPFAHKAVFAENVNRYDLFIYSEDDIHVSVANIRAFVDATQVLHADEIAGFLRYEKDAAGCRWMPDAHGVFHWTPGSVVRRGNQIFAVYTNEHAAFYILTQAQLKRAIASGGFLQPPHQGKYDMLCAAATDPYTSCGFRKLICVSDLESFLVHHMSNRYAGNMGLPLASFCEQLNTLRAISDGQHPATDLCEVETRLALIEWSKSFYEKPDPDLLDMIPANARSILSIGCGWGDTERELMGRGAEVTALPLDSIIGARAAKLGALTVYGTLDECLRTLNGRRYDCVLIPNMLHLQRDPTARFTQCAEFLSGGGTVVVHSPNFDRLSVLAKRLWGHGSHGRLRDFSEGGVTVLAPEALASAARSARLADVQVRWCNHALPGIGRSNRTDLRLGRMTARNWIFRATRPHVK